jgi:hypothetical protein
MKIALYAVIRMYSFSERHQIKFLQSDLKAIRHTVTPHIAHFEWRGALSVAASLLFSSTARCHLTGASSSRDSDAFAQN